MCRPTADRIEILHVAFLSWAGFLDEPPDRGEKFDAISNLLSSGGKERKRGLLISPGSFCVQEQLAFQGPCHRTSPAAIGPKVILKFFSPEGVGRISEQAVAKPKFESQKLSFMRFLC